MLSHRRWGRGLREHLVLKCGWFPTVDQQLLQLSSLKVVNVGAVSSFSQCYVPRAGRQCLELKVEDLFFQQTCSNTFGVPSSVL